MSSSVYQLIYVSSAIEDFSDEVLLNLLEKSRHNNAQQQITGFLLYSEGNIIQLLEGEKQRVEALLSIIKDDARHDNIIVLCRCETEQREFADWRMGFKKLDRLELPHDIDLFNQLLAEDESDVAAIRSAKIRLLVETFRRVVKVDNTPSLYAGNQCLIISRDEFFVQKIRPCLPVGMLSNRLEEFQHSYFNPEADITNHPQLIVIDAAYGVARLIELCQQIHQALSDTYIPIVVVDEVYQPQLEHDLFKVGAHDYVVSRRTYITLQLRLERLLANVAVRNELRQNHISLQHERAVIENTLTAIRKSFLPVKSEGLDYHFAPTENTNGDMLLQHIADNGKRYYLLADFQGHGLKAAVASPVVANLFHFAIESNVVMDGAALLSELNHALCNQLPAEMFVACVLLECNPDNTVKLWNAAMPEPMLLDATSIKKQFRSQFLPLGVSPHESYESKGETINIQPGETIFLYSDGAIECTDNAGAFLGKQRLAELVEACRNVSQVNIKKLFEKINTIAEGKLHDDISLVAIRPFV